MPLNTQNVKWDEVARGRLGNAVPSASRLRAETRKGTGPGADALFVEWILGPAAAVPRISTRQGLQAVLFDLDGVLVDTAEFHYRAWQRLADELGLFFNRQMNQGFRGVGRKECLEKLLGAHAQLFVVEEKAVLGERKNSYYLEHVLRLKPSDLAPGARELIMALKGLPDGGVRVAIVSASRNARLVLERLGIMEWFDAIVDGSDVTRGKPDPECFLLAADRVRVKTESCLVVEDADAGIRAARAAGMKTIGINTPAEITIGHVGQLTTETCEQLLTPPPS